MIQSTTAMRTGAAAVDLGGQSTVARSGATSKQSANGQQLPGEMLKGFGERMSAAASEAEPLQAELLVVLPHPDLPAAAPEQGELVRVPANAAQAEEALRNLTPEQWLLGMLDQQLTQVQARDAGQQESPLDGRAPPSPTTTGAPAGELFAWLPAQPVASGQEPTTAQADPLAAMAMDRWQSRAAQASVAPVTTANVTGQVPNANPAQPLPVVTLEQVDALSATQLERVVTATSQAEIGEPLVTTGERGQAPQLQGAERALRLQAPEAKWGEQMLHALRENVDMQIQQKIQSATIRLDPPELGSMEILLSHESGRLNVQLSAANADVSRLLQQTSDRLRQELVGQHFVQVNVHVGADSGGQQGQQRQRAALAADELPTPAQQLEQEAAKNGVSGRARDVLVTV